MSTLIEISLRELLDEVSTEGRLALLSQVLSLAHEDPALLKTLAEGNLLGPEASKEAAAALNVAGYTNALSELETLIELDAREGKFQKLLAENPWMFGSEYSELLDRRNFTRDQTQDFVLRRTADGYLEVIEIKTPLRNQPLFIRDGSHNTYYPRSELSIVLGQVLNYLALLDANEYTIRALDSEKVTKIRAKIIIGCTDDDADQIAALRRFNGHLHRVEIITFDQLARIARQVVTYLERILEQPDDATLPQALSSKARPPIKLFDIIDDEQQALQ
jgi:hypothetical protein